MTSSSGATTLVLVIVGAACDGRNEAARSLLRDAFPEQRTGGAIRQIIDDDAFPNHTVHRLSKLVASLVSSSSSGTNDTLVLCNSEKFQNHDARVNLLTAIAKTRAVATTNSTTEVVTQCVVLRPENTMTRDFCRGNFLASQLLVDGGTAQTSSICAVLAPQLVVAAKTEAAAITAQAAPLVDFPSASEGFDIITQHTLRMRDAVELGAPIQEQRQRHCIFVDVDALLEEHVSEQSDGEMKDSHDAVTDACEFLVRWLSTSPKDAEQQQYGLLPLVIFCCNSSIADSPQTKDNSAVAAAISPQRFIDDLWPKFLAVLSPLYGVSPSSRPCPGAFVLSTHSPPPHTAAELQKTNSGRSNVARLLTSASSNGEFLFPLSTATLALVARLLGIDLNRSVAYVLASSQEGKDVSGCPYTACGVRVLSRNVVRTSLLPYPHIALEFPSTNKQNAAGKAAVVAKTKPVSKHVVDGCVSLFDVADDSESVSSLPVKVPGGSNVYILLSKLGGKTPLPQQEEETTTNKSSTDSDSGAVLDEEDIASQFGPKIAAVGRKYANNGFLQDGSFLCFKASSTAAAAIERGSSTSVVVAAAKCWSSTRDALHSMRLLLRGCKIVAARCTCGTAVDATTGFCRCRHIATLAYVLCMQQSETIPRMVGVDKLLDDCANSGGNNKTNSNVPNGGVGNGADSTTTTTTAAVSLPAPVATSSALLSTYVVRTDNVELTDGLPTHMVHAKNNKKKANNSVSGNKKRKSTPSSTAVAKRGRNGTDDSNAAAQVKVSAPKRPRCAFIFFCMARRPAIAQANPNGNFSTIQKATAEEWKKIDAEGRKQFDDEAANDKVRYETELRALSAQLGHNNDSPATSLQQEQQEQQQQDRDESSSSPSAVAAKNAHLPEPSVAAVDRAFQQLNDEWRRNAKGEWVCAWDSSDDDVGEEGEESRSNDGSTKKKKRRKQQKGIGPRLASMPGASIYARADTSPGMHGASLFED